jgi:hypothetical protein
MSLNLEIEQELSATSQTVEDESGNPSSLTLSTDNVGIGTLSPQGKLDVSGSIVLNGNIKTQLSATKDSTVLKGGLIVLDLSPVGGGQLQIGTNTNDDKIFLEAFARDGIRDAAEMLITGGFGKPLSLFSVVAFVTRFLGILQVGESTKANFMLAESDQSPNAGYIRFGDNSGWKLHFGRARENPGGLLHRDTTGVLMTIQDNGNVGIGTKEPLEKLAVDGNIVATGNLTVHGVSFLDLLKRIEKLEQKVAALGSGSGGTTITQASISAFLGARDANQFEPLEIRGSNFQPGEQVSLSITSKVDNGNPFTEIKQTIANSSGFIDFNAGNIFCNGFSHTAIQVQATGLSSSKKSNIAGAFC